MLMNLRSPVAASTQPVLVTRRPSRGIGLLAEIVNEWTERHRSRRDLAQLDARLLRDIGLTPSEATEEAAAPFWKA